MPSEDMKHKTIIRRVLIEVLVLLMVFSAGDMMTAPSESTGTAVLEAVNRKQLEPSCMVDVFNAIHSASFLEFSLTVISIAMIVLLGSDLWSLWLSCRAGPSKRDTEAA